jgi:signal transduction histidine kinase
LAARAEAVARACHEVRGSLTAARLGLAWGAARTSTPASRLRAIELELDRAAAALDDLQGVDGGRLREAPAELVDVEAWLGDSVEAFRPLALARGMDLALRWLGPPGKVRGRRARLAQASDNLIANAIEHGGPPIQVLGQVHQRTVRIEVSDAGPGFRAEEVGLLGRRARRQTRRGRTWRWPRASVGRQCRGPTPRASCRGHGLAIARDVALEHGGTLSGARSDQGARLVLRLPLAD